MPLFRKKPVVIEARQFTEDNGFEMTQWCSCTYTRLADGTDELYIDTLEGRMTAHVTDWIIKGISGEVYPCKHDIFMQTYEPVEENS